MLPGITSSGQTVYLVFIDMYSRVKNTDHIIITFKVYLYNTAVHLCKEI